MNFEVAAGIGIHDGLPNSWNEIQSGLAPRRSSLRVGWCRCYYWGRRVGLGPAGVGVGGAGARARIVLPLAGAVAAAGGALD